MILQKSLKHADLEKETFIIIIIITNSSSFFFFF